MIKILIGTCDKVVYINEQCFSRIEFDKNAQCVHLFRIVGDSEEEHYCYVKVKEVDYINDRYVLSEQYNVIHFTEPF